MTLMQGVLRRFLRHEVSSTTAMHALPRWQQHALRPRGMGFHHSRRHKSSLPVLHHASATDDDEYDSEDEFESIKKADWFERAINLTPAERRLKFTKKHQPVMSKQRPAPDDSNVQEDGPSFSLDLSMYDDVKPDVAGRPTRLGDMSTEEVDAWLEDFEIPDEAAKLNKPPAEVRHLYAKQLRLEQAIYELSLEKLQKTTQSVAELSKGAEVGTAKAYMAKWDGPMVRAIVELKKALADEDNTDYIVDGKLFGPILFLLPPEVLAQIVIKTALNHVLLEVDGVKFIKITLGLGKEIQDEIIDRRAKMNKNSRHKYASTNYYNKSTSSTSTTTSDKQPAEDGKHAYFSKVLKDLKPPMRDKAVKYFEDAGSWSKEIQLKLGSALLDLLENNCYEDGSQSDADVLTRRERPTSHFQEDYPMPQKRNKAFLHSVKYENNRRYGIIQCSPAVYKRIMDGDVFLPGFARYLPMVVPPKHWKCVDNGGYLTIPTKIMRHRDSGKWQLQCAARGEMSDVIRSLNLLADIPWVINREVLEVVMDVWKAGGDFGDLPPRRDLPMPVEPTIDAYMEIADVEARDAKFKEDMDTYRKTCKKVEKKNREYNSLRCDTVYKLQVAEEFQHEEAIYFPYNMDFRGRVYPIPPNLNHLGSDMSRSLLIFKDKKPLGPHGLYWLKVHLAGLYGIDKCSFDDRVKFVDEHMPQILASAASPLGDSEDCRWWQQAEAPFLSLGVVFELARAVQSPDPEMYLSNVPVHMDGSCNGLQHYAALGRDQAGAEQVNLVKADKPQDVYTGVATRVVEQMERDANAPLRSFDECLAEVRKTKQAEWATLVAAYKNYMSDNAAYDKKKDKKDRGDKRLKLGHRPKEVTKPDEDAFFKRQAMFRQQEIAINKEYANMLLSHISRKVVKQTVMTSVYGVTAVGARRQIQTRLEEIFLLQGRDVDEALEEKIYLSAKYASDLTMGSMTNLFAAARQIMTWLSECTQKVADEGQMMSWITPLGLPVTQPYRLDASKLVRTSKQHVVLTLPDSRKVSVGKQKTAFPPNYVHSLDSTHMMMTSLKVIGEDKLEFAAVHDSYWTHACSVPQMNRRLREEFVTLYSQPLLADLREQLVLRFPNQQFPEIPQTGDLNLNDVLESPYFFN
ncbi:hypothetical protein DYB34_000698 [Aphanomyces astaci]|uniref:DNA-directed RNA polymerase n=2 Tax=Aphanomyces astaci TaxID=112090 RepID=A0A3R6VTH3_APHAT|nr:hypothetical protein DYB34_000698 [Aphanomyces astaci]